MTTATKCALCSEELFDDRDGTPTPEDVEDVARDHHAVCPKRPIEVGDYVSWEVGCQDRDFIHGEVERVTDGLARVRITAASQNQASVFGPHCVSHIAQPIGTLRRIPRPAEAQAIGVDDYVEWRPDGSPSRAAGRVLAKSQTTAIVWIREVSKTWTAFEACPIVGDTRSVPLSDLRRVPYPEANVQRVDSGARAAMKAASRIAAVVDAARQGHIKGEVQATDRRVFPRGADRTKPCPTCTRPWGEHFGVACESPRMEGYEIGPVCTPECQCGAHAVPSKPAQWIATSGTKVHTLEWSPAPALVDGIDREVCLARWMENRMAVEGGAAAPNVMTRMQRDVARSLWMQRFGAKRSAELRELVAADREAERCRVRVDIQDVE